VHREYVRLFARCFAEHWPESAHWPKAMREQAVRSVITFVNGITASAVTSPGDWPAETQIAQLKLQLDLLKHWADAAPTVAAAAG